MSGITRREAMRGFGMGAAAVGAVALAPRAAFGAPERGAADPTQETINTLVEAGHLREGVGDIHWAPLVYVAGNRAPGQTYGIADYMNAAMIAEYSRSVNTEDEYVAPPTVTAETNPFELLEVNEIVAAMQVTAAHTEKEFKRVNNLKDVDVRTRYGANATENPHANQVKFRLDAGPSVLYAHHHEKADNTTAISTLFNAWTAGQLDGVYVMTNGGEIRMERNEEGENQTPVLRLGDDVRELTGLDDILTHAQLGSGDAQYLLALVAPNAEYAAMAVQDPGIGAEMYLAPNTHSYETFPVR